MDIDRARAILRERERRARLVVPSYIEATHPKQRALHDDPCQFKVAVCGRRAGKTSIAVRSLLQGIARGRAGQTFVYMGITRETAKRLCWEPMKRLAQQHSLPLRFMRSELIAYADNGAEFWVLGADKEEDIEKCRGPAYARFVIDEAASYRSHLRALIRDAIEPALGDYRGDLWLIGSPGRVCAGYFHDAFHRKAGFESWSPHHWNVMSNPYFLEPERWLESVRMKNRWTEDHPVYRREYLGEWVHDSEAQVYKWDEERNGLAGMPDADRWYRILGIDFGVVDATAFSILAWRDHDPHLYVEASYSKIGLSPSDVAEHVKLLRDRYATSTLRPEYVFEQIVGDTGGMGKAYTTELSQRHGIYVEPAKKTEKAAFIDHLNGDLKAGMLQVVVEENRDLIEEWSTIAWPDDLTSDKREYDDKFEDHLADATLYGWRAARHWLSEPARKPPPARGTPEYLEELAREIEALEDEEETVRDNAAWWERDA